MQVPNLEHLLPHHIRNSQPTHFKGSGTIIYSSEPTNTLPNPPIPCSNLIRTLPELLDLTRSRLGTDTLILREVIPAELLSTRRRDTGSFGVNPHVTNSLGDVPNPTRIDTMFLYHTRLWKKPRLSVKEIYASVISLSRDHKHAAGRHEVNPATMVCLLAYSGTFCECLSSRHRCLSPCR